VAEPRTDTAEFAIDRLGGDYKDLPVATDKNGQTCKAACEGRQQVPGLDLCPPRLSRRGRARCFLKHEIKPPRRKPCCISGVVR
jgi:hypothetical protein